MGGSLARCVAIACVAAFVLVGCGADTDEIESWVEKDLTSYLSTDTKLRPYQLHLVSVDLVHASGNEYTGFATVRTKSYAQHKVPITVTYDGDEGMWQTAPGSFLFLMNEPDSTSSP